jgi:hypothetical protein
MHWFNKPINFSNLFGFIFILSLVWTFAFGFSLAGSISMNLITIIFIAIIGYKLLKFCNITSIHISILKICAISIVSIIFYLFLPSTYESLNTDSWYHFFSAYAHLLDPSVLKALTKFNFLGGTSINLLLQIYSLLGIALIFFLYVAYVKYEKATLVIFLIAALTLIGVKHLLGLGEFSSPHPELRTLPLFLIGSLGISPMIFKSISLLPIAGFIYYCLMVFSNKTMLILIICFSLLMPVIFFNIAMLEFSIWLFSFNTIMLLEFLRHRGEPIPQNNFRLLALILILVCLIRQPAVFSFIPLLAYLIIHKQFHEIRFLILCALIPCIQLAHNLSVGNPALGSSIAPYVLLSSSLSFSALIPVVQNFSYLLFLAIFSIIPAKKYGSLTVILLCYLTGYWIAFHLIDPVVWGMPRYLIEYMAPLIIIGLVKLYAIIPKMTHVLIIIVLPFFLSEIRHNNSQIMANASQEWFMLDANSGARKYHSQIGTPWDEAVEEIPSEDLSNTIFEGYVFSATPLAMNKRTSASDYLNALLLRQEFYSKAISPSLSCQDIMLQLPNHKALIIISQNKLADASIIEDKRWGTSLWTKKCS